MAEELFDNNLIKNYLKGEEESLETLIRKYLKPIYGFICKNVGVPSDAEDITQEVFVRIWKNLKKFDQKKDFKPWIFQIAKNASIDYLRKKKSIPFSRFENKNGENILVKTVAVSPVNLIEKLSDKKILSLVLRDLSDKEQKIINMRYSEGFSFRQIANFFKESVNTVKSRHHRIITHLRKINSKSKM